MMSTSAARLPEPQGRQVHPDHQQVVCKVNDVPSLMEYLREHKGEDLMGEGTMDIANLKTWFQSKDDRVAFYTPSSEENGGSYDTLSFSQLQEEISKCPAFTTRAISAIGVRVAIAMPAEEMAHTATAVLATMARSNATAVPLGPRITWDAMQQLTCQVLVLSATLLEGDEACFRLHGDVIGMQNVGVEEMKYAQEHLQEIRVVHPGTCGRLKWNIYQRPKTDETSKVPLWVKVDDPTESTTESEAHPPAADPSTPVLLLRTSGTTAQPKVVPITRSHLWYAAKSISLTLELTPQDCCINAMPLFHIGGIACNLLGVLVSGGSVILQGPFSDPMSFLGHITAFQSNGPTATWYYASPSMHKALALMAQAQPAAYLVNHLRFCRSASAHMPHELALQVSKLFDCGVIPTYGSSEAMPICSSVPIRYDDPNVVVDTVGYPTGTHVKIVDPDTFEVLPYGEIGEICVCGAGVITHYENLDTGFTPDGWLMTGDLGTIDRQGRLFIKGRSKELIKRGGEQIWPNQVDSVIQGVEGVATAVTFGVPNPLFGEEVATAVVPVNAVTDQEALKQSILQTCKQQLEPNSIPQQIVMLPSTDHLLKGRTGKYLRSKMAGHLKVQAVDVGALRMLESVTALPQAPGINELEVDDPNSNTGEYSSTASTDDHSENLLQQDRVLPHESLNGLRFLVSCFVVHTHVGLFPNLYWVKLQSWTPNMMIFFALGAFQTTCSVARPVRGQWATWVGTKIGSLHALFVVSQFITLPSYVIWSCTDANGNFVCEAVDYVDILVRWLIGTTTGLIHGLDVNYFAWFQSTFYIFLICFPFVDHFLRRQSPVPTLAIIMVITLAICMSFYHIAGSVLPTDFFEANMWMAQFSMVTWGWYLIPCMCAAYFFKSVVTRHAKRQRQKSISEDPTEATAEEGYSAAAADKDSIDVESVKQSTKFWGHVCDGCSLVLLATWIIIATYNDSICLKPETFEAMRGAEELAGAEECHRTGIDGYYLAEALTYDEFIEHVHPDLDYFGRFDQAFALAMGYWKMSAPLILFWIYAMAFGNGITSRIFSHWIMTSLAPLGYPVYLLQYAVQRYYWLATRGLGSKFWWIEAGVYPFPVKWYEYFIVLSLTILLGFVVDRFLVPILMPRTISWGVAVCTWVQDKTLCCLSRLCCGRISAGDTDDDSEAPTPSSTKSTFSQIEIMVLGLTGVQVTQSMELRTLGLDSLGATALLGMLRASVPAARAKKLTLRQLQSCDTVGDLANLLDGGHEAAAEPTAVFGSSDTWQNSTQAFKPRSAQNLLPFTRTSTASTQNLSP